VALAPEDRKNEGLSLIRPVRENLSLAVLKRFIKMGLISSSKEKSFALKAIKDFNIKTPSIEQKIINLSGGNQQKVFLLAGWNEPGCGYF
jgi:ABC-type sugar transport system ATPase subunit